MKLANCCISIADGDHQPPPKSETGIPFVTIANIQNNQFDFTNSMFVPVSYYEKLDEKRKAHKDDVLYSVVGSFGIPVLIKTELPFVFQRHIAILRPSKKIDSRFLYYTMLSRDFYMKADAAAIGAAQRTISLTALRNIEINVPPIETQRRIADILSAYDDLIENNRKQIKLLEESAQRLYKEWFVDLRFPGHEHTRIVDGIPEGWKIRAVSDFGKVVTGKTPSTSKSEYYDGNIPFVTIPDMHNTIFPLSTEKHLSEQGANTQKSKFIPPNSVMVSCIATVGLVSITSQQCQTNQQINSVVLKSQLDLYFLYFAMKRIKSLLDGVGSNGATMTNVNKMKFENINILYPESHLINCFFEFSMPVFRKILILSKENLQLQQVRDRLLPKLMSGEVKT